jgi:hypothetical protein
MAIEGAGTTSARTIYWTPFSRNSRKKYALQLLLAVPKTWTLYLLMMTWSDHSTALDSREREGFLDMSRGYRA